MAVYYTFDNTGAMHNGCFYSNWLNLHSKYLFYQPSVYAFPWNQINFFWLYNLEQGWKHC